MKKQDNFKVIIGQSQIPLITKLIGIEVLFLFLTFIFANLTSNALYPSGIYAMTKFLMVFILTFANAILVAMVILEWLGRKYVVRKNDITIHRGFFTNSRKVVKSAHIASVELKQNIFEKILNYGTIKIYSPMLKRMVYLQNITRPKEVVMQIKKVFKSKGDKKVLFTA